MQKKKTFEWDVTVDLLKETFILFSTWKILLLVSGIAPLLLIVLDLFEGFLALERLKEYLFIYFTISGILTILLLLGYYLLFIPCSGRNYQLHFEMDTKGVTHTVSDEQFKKSKRLARMNIFLGNAEKCPQTAGSGYLASSRQSMYTSFQTVQRIVAYPKRNRYCILFKNRKQY